MSEDQWLEEGNCGQCRRANYCTKTCTARKRATDRLVKQAFYDVLEEKYPAMANFMDEYLGMNRYDE